MLEYLYSGELPECLQRHPPFDVRGSGSGGMAADDVPCTHRHAVGVAQQGRGQGSACKENRWKHHVLSSGASSCSGGGPLLLEDGSCPHQVLLEFESDSHLDPVRYSMFSSALLAVYGKTTGPVATPSKLITDFHFSVFSYVRHYIVFLQSTAEGEENLSFIVDLLSVTLRLHCCCFSSSYGAWFVHNNIFHFTFLEPAFRVTRLRS